MRQDTTLEDRCGNHFQFKTTKKTVFIQLPISSVLMPHLGLVRLPIKNGILQSKPQEFRKVLEPSFDDNTEVHPTFLAPVSFSKGPEMLERMG